MRTTRATWLALLLTLSGCATPVPVTCPPLPPLPAVLQEQSALRAPNLLQHYNDIEMEFSASLLRALKPPKD